MKPYLAVIYDSLVEAVRAKTLWFLLFAWTAILAAIAPFGFINDKSFKFSARHVEKRDAILEKLELAAKGRGTKAQLAVVAAIKPESREFLAKPKKTDGRGASSGRISDMLNEALEAKEMYSEEAWPKAKQRSELKDIIAKPVNERTDLEREHLNRRLIENAFSGMLENANENHTWIGYAGMKLGSDLPISEDQTKQIIELFFLQGFMQLGLGVVAMFVAIIVTSPMVPDMFQAGALHLLLSKPISRSLLYLSKFTGGCSFVAINITYLLVGLYFLVGLRLNIWNSGILLCIPVFIFIFMIFYSVSSLAGLIWKNPIISIAVTGLFWAICFSIGFLRGVMQPFVLAMPEVVTILPVQDQVFGVRQDGGLTIWDSTKSVWQPAFDTGRGGNQSIIGPFWFPNEGELYFGRTNQGPFGGFDSDNVRVSVASLPELSAKKGASVEGQVVDSEEAKEEPSQSDPSKNDSKKRSGKKNESKAKELWSDSRVDTTSKLPSQTRRIIEVDGSMLALTDTGLYRFDRQASLASQEAPTGLAGMTKEFLNRMVPGKPEAYRRVSLDEWQPKAPMDIASVADGKRLVVYSQGKLFKLNLSERGMFEVDQEATYSDKKDQLALIIANDRGVLTVGEKEKVEWRSFEDFENPKSVEGLADLKPKTVHVSEKGQMAILTSDGEVWWVDPDGRKGTKPPLTGQGKASAIAFDQDGSLLVAHHVNQVDRWDSNGAKTTSLVRPAMRTIDRIYYWIVSPIYTVNPKPSAVSDTITYCLKKEENIRIKIDTSDLAKQDIKIDPWEPLWSNTIFMVVILAAGCWYLHRQDL